MGQCMTALQSYVPRSAKDGMRQFLHLSLTISTSVTHVNQYMMCGTTAPQACRVRFVLGTSSKRSVTLQVGRKHRHLCGWATLDFNNQRRKQFSLLRKAGVPFSQLLRLPSCCKFGIRKRSSASSLIVITRRAVRGQVASL